MNLSNKVLVDYDSIGFITEDALIKNDVFRTLSVTCDSHKFELMIFLGKTDDNMLYEVRVYKEEPSQGYVIHDRDRIVFYCENDEYATFRFNTYDEAKEFITSLTYRHPEYHSRPKRKVSE